MKIFRFNNKKQRKQFSLYATLASAAAVTLFVNFGYSVSTPLLYFLIAMTSFIGTMMLIRQSSIVVEEIILDGDKFKFYFFNRMKDKYEGNLKDLEFAVESDFIQFKDAKNDKFKAKAIRQQIEEGYSWEEMVQALTDKAP